MRRYFGTKHEVPNTVMELVQVVPVARSVPMLLRRVHDLARLRRAILSAQTFVARAYTGDLEQDADVVALVHRPGYYDKAEPQDAAELVIAKQRQGPAGSVSLGCDMRFVRFYEASDAPA